MGVSRKKLSEQVVVVTGASSGIGEATARELARRGFHVLAGVRRSSTSTDGWSASNPSSARRKTSALAASARMAATHSCRTLR